MICSDRMVVLVVADAFWIRARRGAHLIQDWDPCIRRLYCIVPESGEVTALDLRERERAEADGPVPGDVLAAAGHVVPGVSEGD